MTDKKNKIVENLESGKTVIFPTDTLYALSCNAASSEAVKKLYIIKQRDESKPLPIFIKSLEEALKYAEFDEPSLKLAKEFWPGSLTIVVKAKQDKFAENAIAKDGTVALRVPSSGVVAEIMKQVDFPIIGTSANLAGRPNIYTYQELETEFSGLVGAIYKADITQGNLPSTIVKSEQGEMKILRLGVISEEKIHACLSKV